MSRNPAAGLPLGSGSPNWVAGSDPTRRPRATWCGGPRVREKRKLVDASSLQECDCDLLSRAGPQVRAAQRERVGKDLIQDRAAPSCPQRMHEQAVLSTPTLKEAKEAGLRWRRRTGPVPPPQSPNDLCGVQDCARSHAVVGAKCRREMPRMLEAADVGGCGDRAPAGKHLRTALHACIGQLCAEGRAMHRENTLDLPGRACQVYSDRGEVEVELARACTNHCHSSRVIRFNCLDGARSPGHLSRFSPSEVDCQGSIDDRSVAPKDATPKLRNSARLSDGVTARAICPRAYSMWL
jgi:hypothetical protein